jgi:membrane-associated phospholipid phosphatase
MKRLVLLVLGLVLVLPTGVAFAQSKPQRHRHQGTAHVVRESGKPVVDWNQELITLLNTPGVQPATIQPTWSFAMLHAAIYDAVNSIDRTHRAFLISVPAPRDASETAAADAAAHTLLTTVYPSQQSAIEAAYEGQLASVPEGPAKVAGVRVGTEVARGLLAIRSDDGATTVAPPFVPGTNPGDYRPTPPNLPAPVFTTWGQVTPFVLESGDQFRPAPPPALTTREYAAALNEVQSIGSATSTTRTPDQTLIGQFWAPPIQNFWNQIAEGVATSRATDLPTTARLFASLNLSIADATIAMYDAKYTYQRWRPVSAIRLADTDGNPLTTADPNWLPLAGNTPADPSYPGAHSTVSAAGAEVLASFFGDHQRFSITSPAVPGATRSFTSFSAAVQEAGLSRIYAGVHTRIDHLAGLQLGDSVAEYDLRTALQPELPIFGR